MKITEIPAKPKEQKQVRVAAYARVSADKDAAFHSLEAQTEYYQNYIKVHPNWTLIGIYSDNGISGTTINRPEFQRMLEDCRAGKINLVVTKSVTRFARNTVILLETIRELKALGIDCFFEKEQMHSISPDGELLLTLLAMYAEEEARSASENQLWRIRKKFEKGEPTYCRPYGYIMVDGKLQIVPEEASVVRQIFESYLAGDGYGSIAKKLSHQGVPALFGKRWRASSVYNILRNEKYTGDMMLQKYYTPDFRTKREYVNRGKLRQYYVADSHEAIIDHDMFARTQAEIANRSARYCHERRLPPDEYNLFAGFVRCGICGGAFVHKQANGRKYRPPIWICSTYFQFGKERCPSQKIPESILLEKAREVLCADTITRELLAENLIDITVPEHNHLIFRLKDGSLVDVYWKHPSRSLSWTPEMRQEARERALKQQERRHDGRETQSQNH